MALLDFIAYLSDRGLIEAERLNDHTNRGFENRLLGQKYVYIAKYYGLNLKYKFKSRMFGPYDASLVEDLFTLKLDNFPPAPAPVPTGLDGRKFLYFVKGRSLNWLEIAATILCEGEKRKGVLTHQQLYLLKPRRTEKYVDSVYSDVHRLILTA